MKKLIIGLCLMLGISGSSMGKGYEIRGNVKNMPDGLMYLTLVGQTLTNVDSVWSKNGIFSFKGSQVSVPRMYIIRRKGVFSSVATLYLENGEIKIEGTLYAGVWASGTALNDAYTYYVKTINPLYDSQSRLFYEMKLDPGKRGWSTAQYKEKLDSVNRKISTEISRLVKLNSKSVLGLEILNTRLAAMSSTAIEETVALLDPVYYKGNEQVMQIKARAQEMKKTEVGRMAPDFSVLDTAGKSFSLSAMRGKYVLIDFWASWCMPCRSENPNVKKAYDTYKNKGFEVLGVSLDKKNEPWLKAIHTDGLTWTNVIDPSGMVAKKYAILGIPQNFLIDPSGKIIATGLKQESLLEKLEGLFL